MSNFERDIGAKRGAHFFREGDKIRFKFVSDPATVIGPRDAGRSDQENHPAAWAEFVAEQELSALDRDASGEAGGSLPNGGGKTRRTRAPKVKHDAADDHSNGG